MSQEWFEVWAFSLERLDCGDWRFGCHYWWSNVCVSVQLHMIKKLGQGPMVWQPLSRCLTIGQQQPDPCCIRRYHGTTISLSLPLSSFYAPIFSLVWSPTFKTFLLFFLMYVQEIPWPEKGAGTQKTAHQEAAKRLHAIHEGDACECGRRVHTEGERRHQSDPGTEGGLPREHTTLAPNRPPSQAQLV